MHADVATRASLNLLQFFFVCFVLSIIYLASLLIKHVKSMKGKYIRQRWKTKRGGLD